MKRMKIEIFVTLLFIVVGIAAVTTNLVIQGNTDIVSNTDDFLVYFSNVLVDGVKDTSLIENEQKLVFGYEFSLVGDKKTITYDVTNASKNYDAEISINCTDSTEYIKVTNTFDTDNILLARGTRQGTLVVELKKSYTGSELVQNIICDISTNAVERDSINNSNVVGPLKPIISFVANDVTYTAEKGMTWREFIDSDYNLVGDFSYSFNSNWVLRKGLWMYFDGQTSGDYISLDDVIVPNAVYNAYYCCFDAGSQVLMADGTTKNIEDVEVGDLVMSLNEDTGEFIVQRVSSTIINKKSIDLVYVYLSNGTRLGMRAYHPLLTIEGWKTLRPDSPEAQRENIEGLSLLEVGDTLVGYEDDVTIVLIEQREDIEDYYTYNLGVDGYHNYVVEGIVAHNIGCK